MPTPSPWRAFAQPALRLAPFAGAALFALLLLPAPTALAKERTPILPRGAVPVGLREQALDVRIDEGIAQVDVRWRLANAEAREAEVEVLYPFPPGAVVSAYGLSLGERELSGRVLPREEAKAAYSETVRRLRDPSLLRHVGGPLFRSSTFPVPARGERLVRFRYTLPLELRDGAYKLVLPLGSAPATTLRCVLRSTLPIRAVWSPTHALRLDRRGEGEVAFAFEDRSEGAPSELVLYYGISPKDLGLTLLAHRTPGVEDGYFLLAGVPALRLGNQAAAGRNLLFVLDTSGSMAQEGKLAQARCALRTCLEHLTPADRFNLLTFDTAVRSFAGGPLPADKEALSRARAFVDGLVARGGTALGDALAAALAQVRASPLPTEIVLVTDGLPTLGETDLGRLRASIRASVQAAAVRLFTFGVGYDVNVPFLDALALENGGSPEFVRPGEDLERAVVGFFGRITRPVLTDVRLAFSGVEAYDLYPRTVGSLFHGQQALLFGRFRGAGPAHIELSGQVSGERRTYRFAVSFPEEERGNAFLPRLWAGRKAGYLIDELRGRGNVPEVTAEIVRLAREHGILTEYTAFLADEQAPADPAAAARGVSERFERARQVETGEYAVRQAVEKEGRKKACTLSEATGADAAAEAQAAAGRVASVDGKTFYRHGDCWVDARLGAAAGAPGASPSPGPAPAHRRVRRFSPEYFELIDGSDELARLLSVGERVRVEWQGELIEVE